MLMKLLLENWRKFLKEEKWEDFEHPKNQWVNVSVSDIENSRDSLNVDLSDELFQLIDTAYAAIGGNFDYKSPADIPGNANLWLATDLDADPEPDALRVGKDAPGGVKLSASGHDGSRAGKDAYLAKTVELLNQPGHYAEMSKGIAHIMITRHDVPHVSDPELVQKALGPEKPITWIGPHPEGKYPGYDGWYTRDIHGHAGEMKIMLGNPK